MGYKKSTARVANKLKELIKQRIKDLGLIDNGYLSATDIDSSGGRSIWTYKGTLTRTINWNQLSTNPKKHVLNNKNRILK